MTCASPRRYHAALFFNMDTVPGRVTRPEDRIPNYNNDSDSDDFLVDHCDDQDDDYNHHGVSVGGGGETIMVVLFW